MLHSGIARVTKPTAPSAPHRVSGTNEDRPGLFDLSRTIDQKAATPLPASTPSSAKATKSTQNLFNSGGPEGHRERLRARFRDGGADALPDYEMLEMILFRVFPRGDTKPLAKALLNEFRSFAEVLNASPARLKDVKGVGDRVVDELKLIRATATRLIRAEAVGREAFSNWHAVLDYCKVAQAYDDKERFRILFLDKRNQLIADEVQQTGTVDHTPVYVREVVKRSLELSATAIVLVHNHPSGDPSPSRADIDMTKTIIEAARPLGITVHDHIIVGRNGYVSLKAQRLM